MLDEYTIGVNSKGELTFIQAAEISFLKDLGTVSVQRASHVEPDSYVLRLLFHWLRKRFSENGKVADWTRNWKCLWRVNMEPSNGPILSERWLDRREALAAEVSWLQKNLWAK